MELSDDGFLSVLLDADEACLLRSHAARGFDLHISLGYIQEYGSPSESAGGLRTSTPPLDWPVGPAQHRLDWLWRSCFLHRYDLLHEDADFQYLYSRGRCWKRGAHVSL